MVVLTTRPVGRRDSTPSPKAICFAESPSPLRFRSGGVAFGGVLSDTLGRLLCNGRLRFFPLKPSPLVRRVFAPATTALRLSRGLGHLSERWESPHANTGTRIRSYVACVRRAGSVCVAGDHLEQGTTAPKLADHKIR